MGGCVAPAVGDAVSLGVGPSVTLMVGRGVALSSVGRGVALRTKTTGSGSAVGIADGLQAVDRHPSVTGNSFNPSARIPIRFMGGERLACFVSCPHAIIMGL